MIEKQDVCPNGTFYPLPQKYDDEDVEELKSQIAEKDRYIALLEAELFRIRP